MSLREFYFANDSWDYYKGVEEATVPLRVRFMGSVDEYGVGKGGDYDMQYEIVSFFSGPEAFDEEDMEFVFEDWYDQCDTSKYCAKYNDSDICTPSRGMIMIMIMIPVPCSM